MGVEFHHFAEYNTSSGWALCTVGPDEYERPIDFGFANYRRYGLYAFLYGIRPLRGLPPDLSAAGRELTLGASDGQEWGWQHTWLNLRELAEAECPPDLGPLDKCVEFTAA